MAQAQIGSDLSQISTISIRPVAVGRVLLAGIDGLLAWQRRARERSQLAELSDTYLKDMGLSRADILRETSKPFWRG